MLSEWIATYGRQKLIEARFNKFLKLLDEGRVKLSPENIIDAIYANLRVYSYPISARDNLEIQSVTGASTDQIMVNNEDGWHYRIPKNRHAMGWSTANQAVGRVSLNVHAEQDLINKLDSFCTRNKAYYKTANQIAGWEERHDSITMYFFEPITPVIQKELTELVMPHVREITF